MPPAQSPLTRLFGRSSNTRLSDRLRAMGVREAEPTIPSSQFEANRQFLFLNLRELAARQALHVAPEVALEAIFTFWSKTRDGSLEIPSALRGGRVDFLVLDGAAAPVLAIDYKDPSDPLNRLKHQAFEMAGVPLLDLVGGVMTGPDLALVESCLRDHVTAADDVYGGEQRRLS